MTLAAEQQLEHIGESCGCADHDYDLIEELSIRLKSMWRYDQYIANAEDKPELQAMWRDFKRQERQNVDRMKQLLAQEIQSGCF